MKIKYIFTFTIIIKICIVINALNALNVNESYTTSE